MFCKKCGSNLDDAEKFCPYCGTPTDNARPDDDLYGRQPAQPPYPPYSSNSPYQPYPQGQPASSNAIAIVGFVLSFFFALPGLICSIIGYRNALRSDGNKKGLALAGIIISAVSMILGVILVMLLDPNDIIGMLGEPV